MVGKWHLGMDFPGTFGKRDWSQPVRDMPLDKGFDYFYGIPASMNYGVLAWFEGRFTKVPPTLYTSKKPNKIALSDYRIMPPYDKAPQGGPAKAPGKGKPKAKGRRRPSVKVLEVAPDFIDSECLTRFTDKAIEWIESKAADARKGKPFFVYVPYTSPHKPVIPIDQFRGKSQAGAYGDFMIETDWHVGRILKVLDDQKLAENTLVIYTSDNGPENTWKQRIEKYKHYSAGVYREGKRSIYEGGHRVPFVLRWPAKIKAGAKWDQPVCQTDLLATFAQMLGAKLPDNAGEDSVSFYPVLSGDVSRAPARQPVIHHASSGRFAIRSGKWKLVMEAKKDGRELYDLQADPSETKDVARQNPQVVKRMTDQITAIVSNGRTTPGKKQPNDTGHWSDLTWMKPGD